MQPQGRRGSVPAAAPHQDFTVLLSLRAPQARDAAAALRMCFAPLLPAAVPILIPMLPAPNPRSADSSEFPNPEKLAQRGHHGLWVTFWAPQPPSHASFWSFYFLKNRQHLAQPGHPLPTLRRRKNKATTLPQTKRHQERTRTKNCLIA